MMSTTIKKTLGIMPNSSAKSCKAHAQLALLYRLLEKKKIAVICGIIDDRVKCHLYKKVYA